MPTIQELMQPRYKVIAMFPNITYKIGDILHKESYFDGVEQYEYSEYPHIFKRLEWWEGRPLEELPQYIKSEYYQSVIRADWKLSLLGHLNIRNLDFEECWVHMQNDDSLPATHEEYETYLSKKSKLCQPYSNKQ